MIIKKFQAKTEEEALKLAKEELGENVVVLNVKKDVKPKGFLSFLKSRLVEVTVAKEEESELQARDGAREIRDTIASVDKLRQKNENESKTVADSKNAEKTSTEKNDTNTHTDVNKKLDSIQSLLEQKLIRSSDENPVEQSAQTPSLSGNSSSGVSENNVTNETNEENQQIKEFMNLLLTTMVDNEVDEKYAKQMITEVEQNFEKDTQMEYILSFIYQKLILKFGKTEYVTPAEKRGPKVIFFIGPTGVGKTTTLAKIASKLQVVDHKKIALFTTDTYRIAATNQLETYARILSAPFKVIYTSEDLDKEFDNFMEYDYILIDTAGHSHKNEEQKKQMKELLHALDEKAEKEVYLVLAASTKYRDLINISDVYSEITEYRMIFTKLDETSTYGNILNLRIHTDAPLSYVTVGQNVPDDIEKFSAQDIVRKLLGGNDMNNSDSKKPEETHSESSTVSKKTNMAKSDTKSKEDN